MRCHLNALRVVQKCRRIAPERTTRPPPRAERSVNMSAEKYAPYALQTEKCEPGGVYVRARVCVWVCARAASVHERTASKRVHER